MTAISGTQKTRTENGEPQINMIYLSYTQREKKRASSSIRFGHPRVNFTTVVRHTLIIIFSVCSVFVCGPLKFPFLLSGKMVRICFVLAGICFSAVAAGFFVRNEYKNGMRVRLRSGWFFCRGFFWHDSKRLKIYCWALEMRHLWCSTNKQASKSIMTTMRRERKRGGTQRFVLFMRFYDYRLGTSFFSRSHLARETFLVIQCTIIFYVIVWINMCFSGMNIASRTHSSKSSKIGSKSCACVSIETTVKHQTSHSDTYTLFSASLIHSFALGRSYLKRVCNSKQMPRNPITKIKWN